MLFLVGISILDKSGWGWFLLHHKSPSWWLWSLCLGSWFYGRLQVSLQDYNIPGYVLILLELNHEPRRMDLFLYVFTESSVSQLMYKPGLDINLWDLIYEPPRNGPTIWEIGVPDRSAAEFYVPDPNPLYINKLYINHPDRFVPSSFKIWGFACLYLALKNGTMNFRMSKEQYHGPTVIYHLFLEQVQAVWAVGEICRVISWWRLSLLCGNMWLPKRLVLCSSYQVFIIPFISDNCIFFSDCWKSTYLALQKWTPFLRWPALLTVTFAA